MPPDRTSRPRQEPVSCNSCRRKKLKCDRRAECANCRSRGIDCRYQGRQQSANGNTETHAGEDTADQDLRAEHAAIKTRLQRLEEHVFRHAPDPAPVHTNASINGHEDEQTSLESRELFSIGVFNNSRLAEISEKLSFRIVDLSDLVRQSKPDVRIPCQILLPDYEIFTQLLDSYIHTLDSLQHVLYTPAISGMGRLIYECLKEDRSPELNKVALMLSILCNITAHWSWGGGNALVPAHDAFALTVYWLKCALDVLEQTRRSSNTTLHTVQTHIILLFVLYRMDSFSTKVRYVHANAIAAAKDIGLHITDAKAMSPELSPGDVIDLEIRRRVWWHLCSTDWCIPLIVSEESTYSIDPLRMRVKKPRNINDSDLIDRPADFERPLSEPTSMSYYLHRIRLGELCREVSDIFWTWNLDGIAAVAYDRVLAVDRKFDELADGLPEFLRDDDSESKIDDSDGLDAVAATQRSFMRLTSQVRRAKLHLPFMLRVSSDARFQHSREKCLQLARRVLAMRHLLPSDQASMKVRVRLTGVLHHFFIAIAVLVMDLCVNRGYGDEEERKEEIKRACTILEDARLQSEPADMFLNSVTTTLQKHKIRIRSKEMPAVDAASMETQPDIGIVASNGMLETTDLGSMWEKYFDFDATSMLADDWDALFTDLATEMS